MSKRVGLFLKRALDVVISGVALLILSPVYVLVSLLVLFTMGAPTIFTQERPGWNGRPFVVRKFRTMTSRTVDVDGRPLGDAERTLRLGFLLRKTSLDELPQLISVICGDMSLVGPRPLLMEYLPKYTPTQARRHEMRPGITGWAQVNGRQTLVFSERFRLDVWYIDNWSLLLDLRILAMTAVRVFRREGVITGQDISDVDDLGFNRDDDHLRDTHA